MEECGFSHGWWMIMEMDMVDNKGEYLEREKRERRKEGKEVGVL